MSQPKHRARAVEAMADQLCCTRFTNGFCRPRDGKCQRSSAGERADLNCTIVAEGLMQSMESRGMSVIWEHDPANHVDPFINAAELAAIKGLDR